VCPTKWISQVNQAAAYGFLLGGFAVPSWKLQFNTLQHSFSLAIASPVLLSQIFNPHLSSPLSSDEDDSMLAV
jgi:hypothetical protein